MSTTKTIHLVPPLLRDKPIKEQRRLNLVLVELLERGLSLTAIRIILELYENVDLSDKELRGWRRRLQDQGYV